MVDRQDIRKQFLDTNTYFESSIGLVKDSFISGDKYSWWSTPCFDGLYMTTFTKVTNVTLGFLLLWLFLVSIIRVSYFLNYLIIVDITHLQFYTLPALIQSWICQFLYKVAWWGLQLVLNLVPKLRFYY